jgi:hypothetical protein
MPRVKLTIRDEPYEVDERELEILRGQGLLEAVLDEPGVSPQTPAKTPVPPVPPVPAAAAGKPPEEQ